MKYYLIPFVLASAGDLAPLGIDVAKAAGAVAMSEAEAINVINKLKNI